MNKLALLEQVYEESFKDELEKASGVLPASLSRKIRQLSKKIKTMSSVKSVKRPRLRQVGAPFNVGSPTSLRMNF